MGKEYQATFHRTKIRFEEGFQKGGPTASATLSIESERIGYFFPAVHVNGFYGPATPPGRT